MFTLSGLPREQAAKTKGRVTKLIACDEGEVLHVDAHKDYFCGGKYIGRAKDFSRKGEIVQNFIFNGQIPKGHAFVYGQHKDSYDSRYWGFLDKSRVIALAHPIW